MNIEIRIAELSDINELSILFDEYRTFYSQKSDIEGAKKFLRERIILKQSTILVALKKNIIVGFTQLYPTFSSVSMKPSLILNDLYVNHNYRDKGVGYKLLLAAKEYAKLNFMKGLQLETSIDNYKAKALYEKFGFIKDDDYDTYFFNIDDVLVL